MNDRARMRKEGTHEGVTLQKGKTDLLIHHIRTVDM